MEKIYIVKVQYDYHNNFYCNLWYNEMGQLHREDGPAAEYANGDKEWHLNGKYHREDGPAIEYANGAKKWWLNGKRHREDGPAIEWADGSKEWYLNGVRFLSKDFEKEIAKRQKPSCNGKIVEIDGKKYKLTLV